MTIRLTFMSAPGADPTLRSVLGDTPLSERDLREVGAARAAVPLHGLAIRAPSLRCSQTAEALGLTAVPEPALRDLDLGVWSGRRVDEVTAADPHGFTAWLTDPDAAPHEGESVRQLCRRTANWLTSTEPDTDTLAVTEAAVVRAALIHALAVPARAFWHLAVPPLSAVTLTRRRGYWDVRFDYRTPREDRRWLLSQPALPAPTDREQPSLAHLPGGKRPAPQRETVFVRCG